MPLTPGRSDDNKLPAHQKLDLLHDLALGDLSFAKLGEKYDRPTTWVFEFAKKAPNEEAVRRIREAGMDRMAGLWVASKQNRVAALQADAEEFADSDDPQFRRLRQTALRGVAEELGQLKQVIDATQHVTIHLVGDGADDL